MKLIEKEVDNHTIKIMVISYRFKQFPNIVCSGGKIYQLPCQIGKKSYQLKELKLKYHFGSKVYLIESKRVNVNIIKNDIIKVKEEFTVSQTKFCPF